MIDEIRKQKRILYKDEINETIGGYSETKQIDLKKSLENALHKLPDIQKQLILLKDYEGYSYEEMASITGLNEGQVKINLYRARTFLKQELISVDTHI
jgi:RNA polymerase sigma-70 factor (ECF subfamily)